MNIENLTKLADKLESLPEDYEDFGMQNFINIFDAAKARDYAKHNGGVSQCGTAACAVGHGPAAGILFPEDDEFWREGGYIYEQGHSRYCPVTLFPDWLEYSNQFFIDGRDDRPAWEWCFGGGWHRFDDHHWGAAARIRYLLDGNEPPRVDPYDEGSMPFDEDYILEEHVELYAKYRKTA